jgi:hypothetical protein
VLCRNHIRRSSAEEKKSSAFPGLHIIQESEPRRLAQDLYEFLTTRGLKVFYAVETLEKLGVSGYKAAIDEALDSASVLVAVGTSTANLNSQWVRYEWDSFFNDILSGGKPDARLFSYVSGVAVGDLPRTLRQNQVICHSDGAHETLFNFIANAIGAEAVQRPREDERSQDVRHHLEQLLDRQDACEIGDLLVWCSDSPCVLIARMNIDFELNDRQRLRFLTSGWDIEHGTRIWTGTDQSSLSAIAAELLRVNAGLWAFDNTEELSISRRDKPRFSGKWFRPLQPGIMIRDQGYIDIACKQCGHEDDIIPKEMKYPEGCCPRCGLRTTNGEPNNRIESDKE